MDSFDQALMEACFTNASLGRVESFTFRCRQCTDIADFFVETGPKFRFPVWESYLRDQSKEGAPVVGWSRCVQPMNDFCRAVKEAEAFLQGHCCTSAGKNDWQLCAKGLAKLDTGEAYDVHLQNLIWSKAGLEASMMYAVTDAPRPRSEDVQKLVAACRRVLCRYGSSYKEHRILMDRLDFNDSIQSLINGSTKDEDKYLAFLLRKSQATLPGKSSASAKHPDLVNAFEVSDHEFGSPDSQQALGEGSFGKVYSTVWFGQIKVAVKLIPIYYESDSDTGPDMTAAAADENFKAEVSLLARLQSPYIVQLIGWAIDRNKSEGKLVTELMSTDLAKVLQATENRNGLPLHVAVDIMLQVSKGMEYVHGQNIIHRDIKPSNILLQPSSVKEFWTVKICDFGIAKMKVRQGDQYSTFKIGTMWYRSPEVLSEQEKYGNRADVYSFAIMCSEMLGGYSATLGLSKGEGSLLSRVQNNQRPIISAECPAQLSDLIRKCWLTEPHKRPPFSDITMTLGYVKFVLMRVPAGVNIANTASLVLTSFDEYELKACMLGAAQMQTVHTGAAMWDSDESADGLLNPRSAQQPCTRRWLQSGESLALMESITWGRYRLTLQQNANLVLLDCADMTCLWASGSTVCRSIGGPPFVCTLRSSGNLVVHSGRQELWSSGSVSSKSSYKLQLDLEGRAFIYDPKAGTIIWATERKVLNSGDLLLFNNSLTNNGYQFAMQADGNLVLYDENHRPLWASGTNSKANEKRCRCTLQEDGILVVLNGNKVVWKSDGEARNSASYKLELQRDGNVVIVNPYGTRLWETFTGDDDSA